MKIPPLALCLLPCVCCSGADLRPYLGAGSGFDSGPLTSSFDRGSGPFQEITGGLDAHRAGPRGALHLDYDFSLRHYSSDPRLDRATHGLSFDTSLRLTRRWTVRFRDVGYSSSFGDSDRLPALPNAAFYPLGGPEVLHARTLADTVLADLSYSPSYRTSISVGADGFLVERQHRGLADALGWRARAGLNRRYRRHHTLTLSYSLTRFDHTRRFGHADYAAFAVGHSSRLGPRSELNLLAGMGRLRNAGVRSVVLDPEIARLLGTDQGAEIFRLRTLSPHWLGSWTQRFNGASVRLEVARSISDGGGLSGVARQNQASLALSGAVSRSWRVEAGATLRTYRSLDALLYDAVTASASLALARRLGPRTEAVARYHYSFHHLDRGLLHLYQRHQVSLGLAYHFSDAPSR
jgi:hypothetical protein